MNPRLPFVIRCESNSQSPVYTLWSWLISEWQPFFASNNLNSKPLTMHDSACSIWNLMHWCLRYLWGSILLIGYQLFDIVCIDKSNYNISFLKFPIVKNENKKLFEQHVFITKIISYSIFLQQPWSGFMHCWSSFPKITVEVSMSPPYRVYPIQNDGLHKKPRNLRSSMFIDKGRASQYFPNFNSWVKEIENFDEVWGSILLLLPKSIFA